MNSITSAQSVRWLLLLVLAIGMTFVAAPLSVAQPPTETAPTETAPTETAPAETTPDAPVGTAPRSQGDEGAPADGAATTAPGEETATTGIEMLLMVLLVLATLVVPVATGLYLGKSLRMPDHGWKIAVALLAITAATVIDIFGWPPKRGPDLSGGFLLIYELQEDTEEEAQDADAEPRAAVDMNKMIAAIARRVNPGGVKEVTIRQYGPRQIEIIIPGVGDVERNQVMRRISSAGELVFRITANTVDHQDLIDEALKSPAKVYRKDGRVQAEWVELDTTQFNLDVETLNTYAIREGALGPEILVVIDPYNVTGEYLGPCMSTLDAGRPAVSFSFNAKGARLFGQLTGNNLPNLATEFYRHLGIVLDDQLISAPRLITRIDAQGQITGNFTQEEVDDMINVLNAGSLPAALAKKPISQRTISPTLGADMIRKGTTAIAISMVVVLLFMMFYYRFAGLVACLALLANLVLVLGVMISIEAAFTLPGLAGFVLTVGMAVDANVLIFERIREELARGAALRMAIRNGFARATTTIVDANVTTLITAIVLYMNRNEQIRGFAVPLILGIVMSMFTAIFCSRIIFDIAEKKRWLTRLSMMHVIGRTQIDFLGKTRMAGLASAVLIAIGLVAVVGRTVVSRDSDLMDIDFTGGTSVTMVFRDDKPQDIADVRRELTDQEGLESVAIVGLDQDGLEYMVSTRNLDIDFVQQQIHDIFGENLRTYSMSYDAVTAIVEGDVPKSSVQAGGSRTKLTFGDQDVQDEQNEQDEQSDEYQGVSFDTVVERVTQALELAGEPDVQFELSNVNYNPKSEQRFDDWDLRIALDQQKTEAILEGLIDQLSQSPVFPSSSNIGPRVAGDTQAQAGGFLFASLLCMVGYIWIRFRRVMYGLAAVVALVHDVLITLGMLALSYYLVQYLTPVADLLLIDPFKISLPIVAAFLTIIGYSLNDTIVVFDRIREVKGKSPNLTAEMINTSLNQTLSRTLLTSFTTLIVVIILYAFGGQGIHGFAFALVIGVMAGTYSSIFVASPVLLWMSSSSQPVATRRQEAKVAKV